MPSPQTISPNARSQAVSTLSDRGSANSTAPSMMTDTSTTESTRIGSSTVEGKRMRSRNATILKPAVTPKSLRSCSQAPSTGQLPSPAAPRSTFKKALDKIKGVFATGGPCKLKVDPDDRITFELSDLARGPKSPTTVIVTLSNPTKSRQAFKVKCTSNELFRVTPPIGFCEVGETRQIRLTFWGKKVPRSGKHFFSIYHMKSTQTAKTAREVWTPQSKPEGFCRLRIYFEQQPTA